MPEQMCRPHTRHEVCSQARGAVVSKTQEALISSQCKTVERRGERSQSVSAEDVTNIPLSFTFVLLYLGIIITDLLQAGNDLQTHCCFPPTFRHGFSLFVCFSRFLMKAVVPSPHRPLLAGNFLLFIPWTIGRGRGGLRSPATIKTPFFWRDDIVPTNCF